MRLSLKKFQKMMESIELYAGKNNLLPLPLSDKRVTGYIGRWHSNKSDEFFHGHIDKGPFFIGEGVITVSVDGIRESLANSLLSADIIGKPISNIVDLGSQYDAPIKTVTTSKVDGNARIVLKFDSRPVRWKVFKEQMIAMHQPPDQSPL